MSALTHASSLYSRQNFHFYIELRSLRLRLDATLAMWEVNTPVYIENWFVLVSSDCVLDYVSLGHIPEDSKCRCKMKACAARKLT